MNISEFLPFVPATLFVVVSGFVAWRISRTGSIATPASPDLAKRSDIALSQSPSDPAPSDNDGRSTISTGWRLQPERPLKIDVSYSAVGGMQVIHDTDDRLKEARRTAH